MVGATGLEPATPCTPCKCATRLRYAPTRKFYDIRSRQRCHGKSGKPRRLPPPAVLPPPHAVPVLVSVPMSLQAQALSRAHEEPLDLASFLLVENEVEAPWALSPFPVPGGAAIVGIPGRIHGRISAWGVPGGGGGPPTRFHASACPASPP